MQRRAAAAAARPQATRRAASFVAHRAAESAGQKDTSLFTVFRTTWLNDARNHPVYLDLIRSILQYDEWYDEFKSNEALNAVEHRRFFDRIAATKDDKAKKENIRLGTEYDNYLATALRHVSGDNNVAEQNVAEQELYNDLLTMRREDNEDKFLEAIKRTRQAQLNLAATARNITMTADNSSITKITRALQAIEPLLRLYLPVEQANDAIRAIMAMDARYASLPNNLGQYIAREYPRFVDIMNTLQQFAHTYVSSNPHWHLFIVTMTQKVDVREVFKKMVAKCMLLSAGKSGAEELLPLKLDTVLATRGALPPAPPATVGGAPPPASSSSSSMLPTLEAYVQADVIGFGVNRSNVNDLMCGFRDFLIGVQFEHLIRPPLPGRVGARLFYA